MKFKLLFMMVVGFLNCDVIAMDNNVVLAEYVNYDEIEGSDNVLPTPFQMGQYIDGLRAFLAEVDEELANIPPDIDYDTKACKIIQLTRNLNNARNQFLMSCRSTHIITKLAQEDDLVRCCSCLLNCIGCCFCCPHVGLKDSYDRAKFNIAKAIIAVEKDMKR